MAFVFDVYSRAIVGWTVARIKTALVSARPVRRQATSSKTTLTAMLVSSDAQRRDGYGLPTSEYRHLWETRSAAGQPLAASRVLDRPLHRAPSHRGGLGHPGDRLHDGPAQPNLPQGYAMTIVLGQLVLHGLRYTTPSLQVEVTTGQELPVLWLITEPIAWPGGTPVDDAAYLSFAGGKDLRSLKRHIEILPWTPATELRQSLAIGDMIELPTACGKHLVYYPAVLVDEAMRGRFYAFGTSCECDIAYLIQTERDGGHCKDACPAEAIAELCESLPGEEIMIEDRNVLFPCKRLPTPARC